MKAVKDGSKSDVIASVMMRVCQIQAIAQAGKWVDKEPEIDTAALFDAINDIALTIETELNEFDKKAIRLASAS